ncbi:KaiA-binding protein [Haloplanus rallus]|mgnify:FL=1|jgi:KaiC/GvpD/RAD55 family RecA-like ATPase|uniref:KaiA-binding protein n=1 Tax=Haloplanus rallus TaxID=1816183 RepID=A0A6B9F2C0_9EURY|nr:MULTISPECIES: ATPase domain-containing protein [Haloplanus]QGX94475.1 KaiA-binding protein [Haloplanus rallus]
MRLSTGVDGFDELVDGGLLRNRLYILSGPPGSGKTTFSSQFVTEGVRAGEKCLYLSMHETEEELVHDMSAYQFGFEKAAHSGKLQFRNVFDSNAKRLLKGPGGNDFSSGVKNMTNRLVSFINSREIDRLVIDSTMILQYFYPDNHEAFVQFLTSLKRVDATTLLISEMTDPTSYADEHYLAHGVIFMHNYLEGGGMHRGVQIVKMRGTSIDSNIHAIEFEDDGLHVRPEQQIQA